MVIVFCAWCAAALKRLPYELRKNKSGLFFCNHQCLGLYQKNFGKPGCNDQSDGLFKKDDLRTFAVSCKANKKRWQTARIYTPELLRRMLSWTGSTCSYPGCTSPITSIRNNSFRCCSKHAHRVRSSLSSAQKDYRTTLVRFGLEKKPGSPLMSPILQIKLTCHWCKAVFCRKYSSSLWNYKKGQKRLKSNSFCSSQCRSAFDSERGFVGNPKLGYQKADLAKYNKGRKRNVENRNDVKEGSNP
jgi:hypothetical protein